MRANQRWARNGANYNRDLAISGANWVANHSKYDAKHAVLKVMSDFHTFQRFTFLSSKLQFSS